MDITRRNRQSKETRRDAVDAASEKRMRSEVWRLDSGFVLDSAKADD